MGEGFVGHAPSCGQNVKRRLSDSYRKLHEVCLKIHPLPIAEVIGLIAYASSPIRNYCTLAISPIAKIPHWGNMRKIFI